MNGNSGDAAAAQKFAVSKAMAAHFQAGMAAGIRACLLRIIIVSFTQLSVARQQRKTAPAQVIVSTAFVAKRFPLPR